MDTNRDQVLNANKAMREGKSLAARRLEDGFVEMRIPTEDWPAIVAMYPALEASDAAEREHAWRDFRHSPIGEQYLVVATPRQVQRKARHGNKGIIVR